MIFNLFLALQLPLLIRGAEVSGKDKSEVAGVLLLDSSTFPVLVQNLGPQSRMLVGIFDKRQTVVQDPPTLEGDVRHKFINFAQAYGRDETADVSNLLFAQIIVNGLLTNYEFLNYPFLM